MLEKLRRNSHFCPAVQRWSCGGFFCCFFLQDPPHQWAFNARQKPFFLEWKESGSYFLQQEARGLIVSRVKKGRVLDNRPVGVNGDRWGGDASAAEGGLEQWRGSARTFLSALKNTIIYVKALLGNLFLSVWHSQRQRHTINNIISDKHKSKTVTESAR